MKDIHSGMDGVGVALLTNEKWYHAIAGSEFVSQEFCE